MKQEDKVATLEQAQKLVELGIVLDTEKYWVFDRCVSNAWTLTTRSESFWCMLNHKERKSAVPAPDVAELGVLLGKYYVHVNWYGQQWSVYQIEPFFFELIDLVSIKTPEAQARAAALIWLIDEENLKLEDLKL